VKIFLKFFIAGAIAASVNFGSRLLYSYWMPFEVAVILAYLTGMAVAFTLFTYKVFNASSNSRTKSLFRFTVVNMVGLVQTWIFSVLFLHVFFSETGALGEAIAHLSAMSLVTVTSYLLHKNYTF
jgi:putative flippase GtrA